MAEQYSVSESNGLRKSVSDVRALKKNICGFVIAAASIMPSSTVHAGELLVIPYACNAAGGKVRLTPSQDRGYPIIGRRQKRRYTKCSPTRRAHCRRWTIHRFDVDCNGKTVTWAEIVAASDPDRRAWFERGEFVIRMPRTWIIAPNDPCARFSNTEQRRRYTPSERDCAEKLSFTPEPLVRMPPGFAPKFGMNAIFVDSDKAASETTAATDSVEPLDSKRLVEEKPMPIPPVPDHHRTAPLPSPVAQPPADDDTLVAITDDTSQESAAQPAKTEKDAAPKQGQEQGQEQRAPEKVTIINTQVGSNASETTSEREPDKTTTETEKATRIVEVGAGLKRSIQETKDESPEQPSEPTDLEKDGGDDALRYNDNENPLKYILLGLGVAGLMMIAGWSLSRRATTKDPRLSPNRDIATVNWTSNRTSKPLVPRDPAAPEHKKISLNKDQPRGPMKNPPTMSQKIGNRIPQTREEAFAVLGAEVKPNASAATIKKIVDGLRLNWHPDLATDEADRATRQVRLNQINAAWNIIQSKHNQAARSQHIAPTHKKS